MEADYDYWWQNQWRLEEHSKISKYYFKLSSNCKVLLQLHSKLG